MKIFFLITFVFTLFTFGESKVPPENTLPLWQQSESLIIQLGARDKNAVMDSYEAVFKVISPVNKVQFEKKITVLKDEWGFVYFPESFTADAKPGEYSWKCFVKNVEIAGGTFNYKSLNELTIPAKK